jgi:hypothetical protein
LLLTRQTQWWYPRISPDGKLRIANYGRENLLTFLTFYLTGIISRIQSRTVKNPVASACCLSWQLLKEVRFRALGYAPAGFCMDP